jgi:aminoglycoside phosphotransferase family enzyme/predicted kinase
MHGITPAQEDAQRRLIAALRDGRCYPHAARHVRLVETHISWVLLAGRYAYKIKKAVNLGFLDFSTLQLRRHFCAEEIRLNRRLAPQLYLDVVPIGGTPEHPELGAQPAIEYAVRMRRFAASAELHKLLLRGRVLPQHMDTLAAGIAQFHAGLPAAEASSEFGTTAAIHAAALENFAHLQAVLAEETDLAGVHALREASERSFAACEPLFEQRRAQGFIRECHGDLHLGNIVLIGGQPVPFDGIEFNPALCWIDVVSEIAFTAMDLLYHQHADLAWRFLNAYLQVTGDYAGVSVLRFYLAYRAAVRAKVSAIRAAQAGITRRARTQAMTNCRRYLELAAAQLARQQPALIITHGLPGSGKSTFAQAALERLQAIRIRSDVERKRLFGLDALADSYAQQGVNIYDAAATQKTYTRLLELARSLLQAGMTVIVDAAFLRQGERAQFRELAQQLQVPFAIASMQAGTGILRQRIVQRRNEARDASEADLAVLVMLQKKQELLTAQESACSVPFGDEGGGYAAEAWSKLEQLLAPLQRSGTAG